MSREDIKRLLGMITITYPNFKLNDPTLAVDVWHRILEPDDAQNIFDAFSVYARTDTSGFAPSPGKLHMMIADRLSDEIDEGEIMTILTMASRNANYGFQAEFDKMPKALQKAVGSPTNIRNWGQMEQDQLNYTFNNIIKAYKRTVHDEKVRLAAVGTNLEKIETSDRLKALTDSIVQRVKRDPLPFEVEEDYE